MCARPMTAPSPQPDPAVHLDYYRLLNPHKIKHEFSVKNKLNLTGRLRKTCAVLNLPSQLILSL